MCIWYMHIFSYDVYTYVHAFILYIAISKTLNSRPRRTCRRGGGTPGAYAVSSCISDRYSERVVDDVVEVVRERESTWWRRWGGEGSGFRFWDTSESRMAYVESRMMVNIESRMVNMFACVQHSTQMHRENVHLRTSGFDYDEFFTR